MIPLPIPLTINEPLVNKAYEDYFAKREYLNDISSLQHKILIEQLIEELRLLNFNLTLTNTTVNQLITIVEKHIIGPGHQV